MNDKLVSLMSDLMEDETIALVKDLIKQGTDPMSILDDARRAMEVVGKRFEKCEYFIPDLMMAGEILKGISDIVRPLMTGGQAAKKKGKVLIGTVAGDIHDIGIDVLVATFVQKVKDFGPAVVGLSGFLTLAFDSMKKTVEALDQAGLRKNIKIMIGGGQMDDEIKKYVKADAYGKDAIAAVSLCKEWLGA